MNDLLFPDLSSGDAVPYERIRAEWNAMAATCGAKGCRKLTDQMKANLRRRWAETDFRDNWQRILRTIPTLKWMVGTGRHGRGHDNWRVDLRYVIRSEDTYSRILEEPDPAETPTRTAGDEARRAEAKAARGAW